MVGHNSAVYNIAPDAEPWLNLDCDIAAALVHLIDCFIRHIVVFDTERHLRQPYGS